MKKEQKEQIIDAAERECQKYDGVYFEPTPKVTVSPEVYWVQAWVKVSQATVQDQQIASRIAAAGAP